MTKKPARAGATPVRPDALPRSARSGWLLRQPLRGLEPTMPEARMVGGCRKATGGNRWEVLEPARSMASKRPITTELLPAGERDVVHPLPKDAGKPVALPVRRASPWQGLRQLPARVMARAAGNAGLALLRRLQWGGLAGAQKSLPMLLRWGMMRTTRLTHSARRAEWAGRLHRCRGRPRVDGVDGRKLGVGERGCRILGRFAPSVSAPQSRACASVAARAAWSRKVPLGLLTGRNADNPAQKSSRQPGRCHLFPEGNKYRAIWEHIFGCRELRVVVIGRGIHVTTTGIDTAKRAVDAASSKNASPASLTPQWMCRDKGGHFASVILVFGCSAMRERSPW